MSSKSDTGEVTEYADIDEGIIEAALDDAWSRYGGGTPQNIRVSAQVEWSGVVDRARGGHRTTRLDGLNLGPVKGALDKVRATRDAADRARPSKSYRAKGWEAQLRALTGHKHGSAAADRAGLAPTKSTLLGWLTGEREPNRANQARIAEAYEALGRWNVDQARGAHAAARHELAERLNAAIRDRYGAEVRLRDITSLDLE